MGALVAAQSYHPRKKGETTFTKDIAPIVWNRCAPCHRPDQAAPFPLLTYKDVKRRADQIAQVTTNGVMPPWLPEPGYGNFQHERRLTADELGLLQQWVAEGAVEGRADDLPTVPTWPEGWVLGVPDLVVAMPQPYTLIAEGRDVYRNFVLPVPTTVRQYVRAVELRPGNRRILHHAFMYVDPTRASRGLATNELSPGFPGLKLPDTAKMPGGQFLTYQPGKLPTSAPAGLAWTLEPGSDLVVQMHLNPTGKPETLQAAIGLYFTDQAPTNTPFKVSLTSLTLDIAAGETNYVVNDAFTLPVDATLIGILPHAHYLAREMRGEAVLPGGATRSLLFIRNWDFNWQGEYQYAEPIALPKGTSVQMRYTYDNSTNNVRNPHQPPRVVTYGPQSSDEMCELWLQFIVADAADLQLFTRAYARKMTQVFQDRGEFLLAKNPHDSKGHQTLALVCLQRGQLDDAVRHLRAGLEAQPDSFDLQFNLGSVLSRQKQWTAALASFGEAERLDPGSYEAAGSLGNVYLHLGQVDEAQRYFEKALQLNPDDEIARKSLQRLRTALQQQRPAR